MPTRRGFIKQSGIISLGFMHIQRDFFEKNPRLNMLIKTYDKMPADKRNNFLETADKFLEKLEE